MEEGKERKCIKCFSMNLRLEKWVFGKKKNRKRFGIKIICLNCDFRKAMKISKELYKLTRRLRWRYKKKKPLEKEGFDYLILE